MQRAWQALWTAGVAIFLLLLFVEFILGIDFIAWIVGDPLGDTLAWIQGKSESVEEAFREKAARIVDSYKNR